ncbi:MAG: Rieske (2Fe-2S) protein [Saprospiraceae bacterium]
MKRRDFIVTGSQVGLGFCFAAICGVGCGSAAYFAQAAVDANKVSVPKSEFQYLKKSETQERPYVFVKPPGAEFPVCLYKSGDTYLACLMRCTHQGCEVEVQGSRYVCPCHGSEFTTAGDVLEGPADQPLKTFKTSQDETFIHIWLA